MKTYNLPENDIQHADRRHPVDFMEPLPSREDQLKRICEVLSRTFGWVAEATTVEQKDCAPPWFCIASGPICLAQPPLNNLGPQPEPRRLLWTNSFPTSATASGGKMSAATRQTTDQVRGIPLHELLRWHGFDIKPEGASIRARSDHHNIVVTDNKWFDNKTGMGGAGGHRPANAPVRRGFSNDLPRSGGRISVPMELVWSFHRTKLTENRRRPFEELAAQYAVPSTGNWSVARDYLVETRKIDSFIVDELHERGSIYANNHRPNPGIVFLHRTSHGKVEGATLRDTRHESSFRPCLGNKLSAWFVVGDLREAHSVVAVESPIEALSYHTLFASRHDRLAIVSCAGSFVPDELMAQAYDRRQNFIVALNNDDAGELGWQRAWDSTADWPRLQNFLGVSPRQ